MLHAHRLKPCPHFEKLGLKQMRHPQGPRKPLILRVLTSKVMFPFLLLIWFLYFTFGRSETKSLRGPPPVVFNALDIYQAKDNDRKIEYLIVVAGHAVMKLNQMKIADTSDAGWYLLSYQQNQGFPAIISSHIKKGVELASSNAKSMLIFSGGQTRRDVGPTSEAASYYYLASEKKWIDKMTERVYLEEYARDSFENLLFSICRFREVQGYYPTKISVVGFDFKAQRYTDLHRMAVGFPPSNFTYFGVQSPAQFDQARAVTGEKEARRSFEKDAYGCNDPALNDKRNKRNPFRRTVPYTMACPEMKDLLEWCGPEQFNVDSLPWSVKRRSS